MGFTEEKIIISPGNCSVTSCTSKNHAGQSENVYVQQKFKRGAMWLGEVVYPQLIVGNPIWQICQAHGVRTDANQF